MASNDQQHLIAYRRALDALKGWFVTQPRAAETTRAAQSALGLSAPPEFLRPGSESYYLLLECLLLDVPFGDGPPAIAHFVPLAPASLQPMLAALEASRFDAWRARILDDGACRLEPLGGGAPVEVDREALEAVGALDEDSVVACRLLPLGDAWWMSFASMVLPLAEVPMPAPWPPMAAATAYRLETAIAANGMDSASDAVSALAAVDEVCRGNGDRGALWADAMAAPDPAAFVAKHATALPGEDAAYFSWVGAIAASVLWRELHREAPEPPPADTAEGSLTRRALALFDATLREDEPALLSLVGPRTTLGVMFDLWGFPALRLTLMLTDVEAAPGLSCTVVDDPRGRLWRAVMRWRGVTGERGAIVFATSGDAGEPALIGARPTLDVGGQLVDSAAWTAAEEGEFDFPWRAEAPDAVEAKLRSAMRARRLPIDRQVLLVSTWRMHREAHPGYDRLAPEAWAAAVEVADIERNGGHAPLRDVADRYGAKKSLVKARAAEIESR